MQLFNIYYTDDTYGNPPLYLITTNNPAQWIKEHNQKRKVEGSDPEILEYMNIEECELKIFEDSDFRMLYPKRDYKCQLCNAPIDNDIIEEYEGSCGKPFKEGYCSDQCEQTDGMIDQHDR